MRILIAEDDTALAGFVRQGLLGEHYAVDVVEDGEQARAVGSEFDYDLVILDLNLPKMDGVSVLRHLRLRRPSLPVLVLTQRSRRLSPGAVFLQRTLGPHPGAVAAQPPAFGIGAGGRRSEVRPGGAPGGARGAENRAHGKGILSAGISDAQRRPPGIAGDDYRARLEPDLRYDYER